MIQLFPFALRQELPGLGRRGLLLLGLAGLAPAAFAQSSFGPAVTYASGGTSTLGVALGDVNGDGRPDIAVASQGTDNVSVLLSLPGAAGTFGPATTYSLGAGSRPTGIALGDVNGDGRLDIVTGNQATNAVGVLLGSAATPGTFAAAVTYASGGNAPNIVALADLNGDGRLDIATANTGGNTVGVLLASATAPGTFGMAAVYSSGGGGNPVGITTGDVNGDGRPDIVTSSNAGGTVAVLLASATAPGTFGSGTIYSSGGAGTVGVALGDVNRDGQVDIVATNSSSSTVSVLLGSATAPGAFAAPVTYPSGGGSPNFALLGDVNGDGLLDIVTANSASGTVGVLTGRAAAPGTFATATTYASGGNGPIGIALGDVNGDGRRDVVTANYNSATVAVLLNTGTFLAAASAAAAPAISLYPNPAHGAFTLLVPAASGAAPGQVELLNALGQVVRRQEIALFRAEIRLAVETTGLPAGVYTVRVRAGATAATRRIVLQ